MRDKSSVLSSLPCLCSHRAHGQLQDFAGRNLGGISMCKLSVQLSLLSIHVQKLGTRLVLWQCICASEPNNTILWPAGSTAICSSSLITRSTGINQGYVYPMTWNSCTWCHTFLSMTILTFLSVTDTYRSLAKEPILKSVSIPYFRLNLLYRVKFTQMSAHPGGRLHIANRAHS